MVFDRAVMVEEQLLGEASDLSWVLVPAALRLCTPAAGVEQRSNAQACNGLMQRLSMLIKYVLLLLVELDIVGLH